MCYDVRHVTYTRDVTRSRGKPFHLPSSLPRPSPHQPPTQAALATAHQAECAAQARRGSFFFLLQRRTARIPSSRRRSRDPDCSKKTRGCSRDGCIRASNVDRTLGGVVPFDVCRLPKILSKHTGAPASRKQRLLLSSRTDSHLSSPLRHGLNSRTILLS